MKVRPLIICAVVSLVVIAPAAPVGAQVGSPATGCVDPHRPALQPSDPAYSDAVELARSLALHDFRVICISPSKWTGTFQGQKGAALFWTTTEGGFDALFLPKPQNFDELQIIHRMENGRHLYSFAGHPTPWPANLIDGPRPTYFIKHMNRLIVAYHDQLAAHLGTTLVGR
jgi:hypothetical protein